ncbi:hypothetical protein GTW51_08910 [Aurantimonas aggregata]|uniref:Uncharacterized protein n=1 Tax=Aurantimonas aggregata TaxID=2047720 RepID=A0A6L9MGX4_9HYPH|nr:hypothetical protein [Aurantimonas aggregata]NDV86822.1 hypothetical protein [Aurantimonas aggregata]
MIVTSETAVIGVEIEGQTAPVAMIGVIAAAAPIAEMIFGATALIAIKRVIATTTAIVKGLQHSAGKTRGLPSVTVTAAETAADPDMRGLS